MASSTDETTPLLRQLPQRSDCDAEADAGHLTRLFPADPHAQFCLLTGVPPSDLRSGVDWPKPGKSTLYGRAIRHRHAQSWTYRITASISNTLLLGQIVLGAAVTALGASSSSHVLITIFGALNTIIAGLVAYLKSRGQPNRARMFRDDLDRIVDELENSEVMWLGIAGSAHGYAMPEGVTVRTEVARLTRLYDRSVRASTMNNPDTIQGGTQNDNGSLKAPKPGKPFASTTPAVTGAQATPLHLAADLDVSPVTAPPKPDVKKDDKKDDAKEGAADEAPTASGSKPADA